MLSLARRQVCPPAKPKNLEKSATTLKLDEAISKKAPRKRRTRCTEKSIAYRNVRPDWKRHSSWPTDDSRSMIEATYLATRPTGSAEALGEAIAREQSLEIVSELIPANVGKRFLGQVLKIEQIDDERWSIRIGYPEILASNQIGQLIQLLYGNVSFYPRIRLTNLSLPEGLLEQFSGPIAGIPGIRNRIDVAERALLLTVLKPRGSSPEHLAELARRFALGGGDILKDDQNLVDTSLREFITRVSACADAVERASDVTGRSCLYLPHVAGSGADLHSRLDWIANRGLSGVVMCPWIMGMETASTAANEFELLWLAHPAGAGSHTQASEHGIAPELIFGLLPRLAGADLTIFPGAGGRISLSSDSESTDPRIVEALISPLHSIKPSLPCSGGGKTLDQIPEVVETLGSDCAVVVGGDLLKRGQQLESATRRAVACLEDLARSNDPGVLK